MIKAGSWYFYRIKPNTAGCTAPLLARGWHLKSCKYVILGAGPSGLSFAHSLLDRGEKSFVVLEQETEAGGLCRSTIIDGSPLDIGGGHFLDTVRPEVLTFLFRFLPKSNWIEHIRISKIAIHGRYIDYPMESHLWQLSQELTISYLESIANAGCVQQTPKPEKFEAWIRWKLGNQIADNYMLPYNRKLWGDRLSDLGTYWLYKLPDVSFRETLRSCLCQQQQGSIPAHGRFLYPSIHGFGEIWKRMGTALGERLLTSTPVSSIDLASMTINGAFKADNIVTTIPWQQLANVTLLPDQIRTTITNLAHTPITVQYHPEQFNSSAHWIYDPDEQQPYHRVLCRHNFLPGSNGYWTETNSSRALKDAVWQHRNEFAYPLNTLDKPSSMAKIISWGEQHNIIALGRWGRWEHLNSDAAVAEAISLAEKLGSLDQS